MIAKVKEWIETYGDGKGLGREMVEGRDFDYRSGKGVYYYRPWDINDIYFEKWTPQQNQNISVNGGTEKTQYTFAGSYMNQNGVLKLFDDYYRRLNASGFLSTQVNKWLTVRGGFLFTRTDEEKPFTYNSAWYDPQYYLNRWHNVYPYGTFNGREFRGGVADMKQARPEEWQTNYNRYNFGTTFTLAEGLTANLDYTYNQTLSTVRKVGGYASGINQWNANGPAGLKFENLFGVYTTSSYDYAQYTSGKTLRNTFNGYITYDKRFEDHGVKIMGGTNIEDSEYTFLSAQRNGVYDFNKGEVNLSGGTQTANSEHRWWSVAGFFGRVNYDYKDKYMFEINGRYDGSSKFAADRRWGFYPSASAAWRMSEEPWMESLQSVVSALKLRASYGEVGNQDVTNAAYKPTLTVTNPATSGTFWLINNNWVPYIASTNAGGPLLTDPTLTWETVTTLDVGVDAGFFQDKLDLTVDWYQRKTLDILTNGESLPASVGTPAALRNFGELTTNGIEIAATYRHAFANGINLTVSGQFTDYKTTVTKFASADDPLNNVEYYEGKVLGEIWGYRTEGLFQQGDFQYDDDGTIRQTIQPDGQSKNTMAEGVANQYILESGPFKFSPGDVRFSDLNGDGVINYGTNTVHNPGDRTIIGNQMPRYQFGFRIGADWKGFDLSIFCQGVGRRSIWATGNMVLPGYLGAEGNFAHTLDYWRPDNTDAFYPRALEYAQTEKWNYNVNDRYLLNAAYLRLKNLTFGYTIPKALVSKVNIDRLRVYFSGENLFELDKMGDVPIDPEIDWTANTLKDKRSFGRSYPYRRTISFGLQLQF